MSESKLYCCPVSGCDLVFYTVKLMIDHLLLYHDDRKQADNLICGINSCMFRSVSVVGFRLHVRRSHADDWCRQRYKRVTRSGPQSQVSAANQCHAADHDDNSEDAEDGETNENVDETLSIMTVPTDYYFKLQRKIAAVVLKHREVGMIPKSVMAGIVIDLRDVLQLSQMAVINSFSEAVRRPRFATTADCDGLFNSIVEENEILMDDIFKCVSSAKQLKAYCRANLGMIMPKEIVLNRFLKNGKWFKHSFQYVSLLETLKNFLSHEDVAAEIIKDTQSVDDTLLRSYKDGSAYKESIIFSSEPDALRLHLYIDDFDVCNPIGSRRSIHKLTAVYFVVGNVHTKHWSRVNSIHLALLARTILTKKYGLQKILEPVINDIITLETEGILVNFCGVERIFKGSIATISADNLASHQIGGFRQTFSSGKVCRFCLASYGKLSDYHSEESCVIRKDNTHESHVESVLKDCRLVKTYGVKGESVFKQVANFTVCRCLPPDPMHDILELLCPTNVKIVLSALIRQSKLSVKMFNDRLDMFVFSKCDAAAKPPHVPNDFASRNHLPGSASQNWCLFRNLPFLVYDLLDADGADDEMPDYWQLHLFAREICKIVFAPVIQKNWLLDLQCYISMHHSLLAKYNKDMFTPKIHFLVHYPRLMELYGPLKHLWCMRFESCHQYYKKVAKFSNNYKNIAFTLSERHQFKACFLMSGENALSLDVAISGKQATFSVIALPSLLQQVLQKTFSLQPSDVILSVQNVQLDCKTFHVNELYVIDITEDEIPVFVRVTHIIENNGLWIICGLLCVCVQYDQITDSFQVQNTCEYVALNTNEIISYGAVAQVHIDGRVLVYLNYRMTC